MAYRTVGLALVRFGVRILRRRYARQIRVGIGITVVAAGVAIYLASREVPEG